MEATRLIQGKEYISVDLIVTSKNAKSVEYACDKYQTIDKEIKHYQQRGWNKEAFIIGSVYVPIESREEFCKSIKDGIQKGSGKSLTDDKNLIILFFICLIAVVGIAYVFRKHLPEEGKPNIFKRIKLWWKNKFSKKKESIPTPTPLTEEVKPKGLFEIE